MHPDARYCKVAQADDVLMPRCLEEMVALAETDEAIGLVGAYTLLQDSVFLDGLDFREQVLDGRVVGRRYFEGGPYILGTPTTCLYRSEVVRAHPEFYPVSARTGDAHAALRTLADHRFGFVHQVLTVTRRNAGSISDSWSGMGVDPLTRRVLLELYGTRFLEPDALDRTRSRLEHRHYRVLGEGVLMRRPKTFWDLHRRELAVAGLGVGRAKLAFWTVVMAVRMLLNLEWFFRPTWPWNR
jgi:hypothetical protein